jgi:hypothetical protein
LIAEAETIEGEAGTIESLHSLMMDPKDEVMKTEEQKKEGRDTFLNYDKSSMKQ